MLPQVHHYVIKRTKPKSSSISHLIFLSARRLASAKYVLIDGVSWPPTVSLQFDAFIWRADEVMWVHHKTFSSWNIPSQNVDSRLDKKFFRPHGASEEQSGLLGGRDTYCSHWNLNMLSFGYIESSKDASENFVMFWRETHKDKIMTCFNGNRSTVVASTAGIRELILM